MNSRARPSPRAGLGAGACLPPGTHPGGAGRTGPGVLPASERQRRSGGATFRQSWQLRSLPRAGWTEWKDSRQSGSRKSVPEKPQTPQPRAQPHQEAQGLCRLPWPPGSQRQLLHLPRREVTYLAMWTELAARERDPRECLGLLGAPHPAGACWLAVHGLRGRGSCLPKLRRRRCDRHTLALV